ncbi:hypothetical protein [Streptomyces sp. NPDC054783]
MDELLDPGFGMPELYEPRLPLLTLTEAHQLLDVLQHFGTMDHRWGAQAATSSPSSQTVSPHATPR